jgi:hypothetical protein
VSTRSRKVPATVRGAVDKPVVELGKKLVLELGLEDAVDTLGRWMAHHVAELIVDAQTASINQRSGKEDRCRTAILELWSRRSSMADRGSQFEPEQLLRAIASLDPETPQHRYFAALRASADEGDDAVSKWLRLADRIDETARMLVGQCLVFAAAGAQDKSQEWIALADAAELEDDAPMVVFRFVNEESDLLNVVDPDGAARERLTQRLARLNAFMQLARIMKSQLTKQLGGIPPVKSQATEQKRVVKRGSPSIARVSSTSTARRGSAEAAKKRRRS